MSAAECSPRGSAQYYWHPRYRHVARNVGPHLWIYDRKYWPRQRSLFRVLWIRMRWQLRYWRWEYGY